MRVLAGLTTYPPSTGGAQLHAHVLHQHLIGRDHDVTVATVWRETRTDWALGTTLRTPAPRPPDELDGVPIRHLGLGPAARARAGAALAAYPPAMRLVAPRLTEVWRGTVDPVVSQVDPDVLHLSRIGRAWFYEALVAAAAERGVPFVLTPNHHPHWTKPWHWWWWDLYRRAGAVLVLSDHEGRTLVDGGVAPSRIVRTVVGPVGGPPPGTAPAAPPDGPPTVVFLGQIRAYKGVELLVAAMDRVRERHPDARLRIVGPWLDADDAVRRRCEDDPRTDVLGAVDEETKWQALRDAHLLCVPSAGEALGGVYLEAWQVGRPAIGADIPPVAELFTRTGGGLAVARDPAAIAGAIVRLLDDPDEAARLAAAGNAAVAREYRWETAAERAEEAYASATG